MQEVAASGRRILSSLGVSGRIVSNRFSASSRAQQQQEDCPAAASRLDAFGPLLPSLFQQA
jgi:hypothetical protein